jgi:hypothetical protein
VEEIREEIIIRSIVYLRGESIDGIELFQQIFVMGYLDFVILGTIVTTISTLSSVLLLILNLRAKKWTGFLQLIFYMTIFQLIFDLGYYAEISSVANDTQDKLPAKLLIGFGQIIGGIATSLYSNVLQEIIVYVIVFRTVIDVKKHFIKFNAFAIIPSVVTFIVYAVGYIYNSIKLQKISILYMLHVIRLLSILFNIICYLHSLYAVRRMMYSVTGGTSTEIDSAIISLVSRLKYYPLVQIICQSGPSLYIFLYGIQDLSVS